MNKIGYSITDEAKLKRISKESDLFSLTGYIDFFDNDINILKKDNERVLNDGRIFEFVLKFQEEVSKLLSNTNDKINLDFADYWTFSFARQDNKVFIDVQDKLNKNFVLHNVNIELNVFIQEYFKSILIFENELAKNPFIQRFSSYKLLKDNLYSDATKAVNFNVLEHKEIEILFKNHLKRSNSDVFGR